MTIKSKMKYMAAASVLVSINGFTSLYASEDTDIAPEATAAEASLSFRELSLLENAYIGTAPAARDDGLSLGELGVDGGEKAVVVKLAKEIAGGKYGNYDSLLVAHKDKLVFESYYKRGRVNLAHGQASATKSYTSLLLGRAIEMGYLTMADLDKPLVSFLNNVDRTNLAQGADEITLHQALTMTTGIRIPEEDRVELERDPNQIKRQKHVQTILEHTAPITPTSQTFQYGTGPGLIMHVIDAVVPGTAQEFIKTEMLDKLGISNFDWQDHPSGIPQAGWRVSMTSRDMLKFGSLVVNDGKWQGEQLISQEYLAKATLGLVDPTTEWIPDDYRYGYFWYNTAVQVGGKTYDVTFAWGGGGQRVIVVKELDLVIAVTGHDREDETIMPAISASIIPAFAG